MKLLFVLAGVILMTSALGDRDEWENYKITYGKTYKSIWEERQRFSVYSETMTRIEEHNEQFEKSKTTYKMGVTKFADWTQEEIDAFLKSSYSSSPSFKREYVPKFNKANLGIRPPAAYDWRDKNVVTEVKDQGECNAGWAFAAAGTLETSLWYFTKKLRSISAQGLIDCIGSNVNSGNNACSPVNKTVKDAYDFMIEKGFAFDEDYPYISENGKSGECKISKFSEVLREYNVLPKGDEKNLQETVAFASPVAAMIDATPLLNYESGIIDANASCKKDSPNHAVVIAGTLETSLWYFTKKLRSISAQGLIDCIGSNVNSGNNACSPVNKTVKDAYDFMIEKGFAFDEDYPYISENGKSGECKISKFSEVLREYNVLPKGDEKNLQETVAFASPVAAMIDATPLLNYESGIIDANASCKKDSPNHAVVIVGYGTDNGTDYWTLKNSFGKNWGEDGFFRLQRGSNVCGIASAAIQPLFRC